MSTLESVDALRDEVNSKRYSKRSNGADHDADSGMPPVYGARDLAKRPVAARRWLVDQWLPAGTNVVFGGHGGVGKSMVMAMLAICVASGNDFYGIPVSQGAVLIYSCEDDLDEWRARMCAAATLLGLEFGALPITIIDTLDSNMDAALFAPPASDPRSESTITEMGLWLARKAQTIAPVLIILDSATDTFGGNENARRDVRRYLRAIRRTLASRGACVIHILHVDKPSARGGATGDHYSGVTDWNNGVRARIAFYRQPPPDGADGDEDRPGSDDEPLRLELQKANYAQRGVFVELRYDKDRRLFVRIGGSSDAAGGDLVSEIRARTDERAVLQALAVAEDADDPVFSSERANRNAPVRLAATNSLPGSFRGKDGKRRLFRLLLRLKADGMLAEKLVKTSSRNSVNVWSVTTKGRDAHA